MARGNFAPRTEAQLAAARAAGERNRLRAVARVAHRIQDLEWMASTGETTVGAADRLGMRSDSLDKWLARWDRSDLWQRMRRNEVARFGATLDDLFRQEQGRQRQGKPAPRRVA